jgi:hypothetical protein
MVIDRNRAAYQSSPMTKENDYLLSMLKEPIQAFQPEDLLVEAVREIVKEEMKRRVRTTLDSDPELRAELKGAVSELLEARIREMYAVVKIAKCGAELGIKMVPKELREKIEEDIAGILAKEVEQVIGRMDEK